MNRKLWENLASLYSVHAFNYVVPLFTLPYLARILGPVEWGAFAFADAYGRFVALAVEYGFGLSAMREVARVRHDPAARGRLLSAVLGAQMFLCLAALAITAMLAQTIPVFTTHRSLLPGALFLALSQGMNPMWYFQALERVQIMGGLWVAGRVAGAVGLFLFVHSPGDGGLALFIQGTAPMLSVVVGIVMAYWDTPLALPSPGLAWAALRSGGSVFLFRAGVSVYSTMNVLLLGMLAPAVAVAWFAGAEKLVRAAASGTGPITQAFYPRISHLLSFDPASAAQTARASMRLMIGAGVVIGLFLFFSAPLLVRFLLGPEFERSIPVLRIMSLLPPLIAVSNAFGVQWMLTLRLDRELNWIILGAGALNVALSLWLGRWYYEIGMAVSIVLAEAFVAGTSLIVLRRRRLDPWRASLQLAEEAAA